MVLPRISVFPHNYVCTLWYDPVYGPLPLLLQGLTLKKYAVGFNGLSDERPVTQVDCYWNDSFILFLSRLYTNSKDLLVCGGDSLVEKASSTTSCSLWEPWPRCRSPLSQGNYITQFDWMGREGEARLGEWSSKDFAQSSEKKLTYD